MKPTETLATSETPDGEPLLLQKHDGEYHLKIGGITLMSTIASHSEMEMAELAAEILPPDSRTLIGGLGFGFTLQRMLTLVSRHSSVDVAELLPTIIEWNEQHLQEVNGKLLDDPRVTILEQDVFEVIKRVGKHPYDAIMLDVDNSPDPLVQRGNGKLYNAGGLRIIRSALKPGGRVVFWSAHQDHTFARSLEKIFKNVHAIPAKAYPKAKKFAHTLFIADR